MKLLELWSGKAKAKKHPPEGLFSKGSATEIANWLKKTHDEIGDALEALTAYKNKVAKNLSDGEKAKLDHVKALLHASKHKEKDEKVEKKEDKKEEKPEKEEKEVKEN